MPLQKPPALPLDVVRPPTSRFRCIDLDEEVTHEFLNYTGDIRCYALLHKSGSFIKTQHGTVYTSRWTEALQQAAHHGADFIVVFHEERIRHKRAMPNGGHTWDRAIFWPHEVARNYPNHIPSYKNADEHGRSPTSLLEARRRQRKQQEKQREAIRTGSIKR